MKKMSVAFLLGLITLIAHAEPKVLEKPVRCDDLKIVIEALTGPDLNEKPVWVGGDQNTKSKYMLTVNEKTRAWTMIQFDDKSACIVGFGDNAKILNIGPNIKYRS